MKTTGPGKKVSLIGLVLIDALCDDFTRLPERGEAVENVSNQVTFRVGGGAANTGAALAQIGIAAKVFGRIGDDHYGQLATADLERHGADPGGCRVAAGEATTYCFVGINADGEHEFVCTYGASHDYGPADVDLEELLDADVLMYQDMGSLPGLDGAPAARMLLEARRRGILTFADENLGRRRPAGILGAMLPGIDWFLPSSSDLAAMLNTTEPDDIVRILRGFDAHGIVLKLGQEGCLVYAPDAPPVHVPSAAAAIVDTTGAGDCFDAGFMAGLLHGLSPAAAAQIGAKSAAACIANIGACEGIPAWEEMVSGTEINAVPETTAGHP